MAKNSALRSVNLPQPEAAPEVLRLDIGCGKTTPEGWVGIDALDFGQLVTADLREPRWKLKWNNPDIYAKHRESVNLVKNGVKGYVMAGEFDYSELADNSVDEVRSSHFVEHLTGAERVGFFNELHRVMKPKATALIVTPNWSHACAYGDPTHQWPPMSQWYALYLNKAWRDGNAPHAPFACDFDHTIAGSWDESIATRNPEAKSFMMNHYTNAWRDLIVTITKRG